MTESSCIGVMIVDDHEIARRGLAALLAAAPGIDVVAEAASGEEAVALHRQHRPDVTLMDLRLPGLDGARAIATIRSEAPRSRFIVLTTYEGDKDVHAAIRAGAQGYLLKGMRYRELLDAIAAVHAGQTSIPAALAARAIRFASEPALSHREREVLGLLGQGLSNQEIAARLGIRLRTVKTHVGHIMDKLDVGSRTEAIVVASQRGLIALD